MSLYADMVKSQGWQTNLEYQRDRSTLRNAGQMPFMLAFLLLLYGGAVLCISIMLIWTEGWANLNHPFIDYMIGASGLALICVVPLFQKSRFSMRMARMDFEQKWGTDAPR